MRTQASSLHTNPNMSRISVTYHSASHQYENTIEYHILCLLICLHYNERCRIYSLNMKASQREASVMTSSFQHRSYSATISNNIAVHLPTPLLDFPMSCSNLNFTGLTTSSSKNDPETSDCLRFLFVWKVQHDRPCNHPEGRRQW